MKKICTICQKPLEKWDCGGITIYTEFSNGECLECHKKNFRFDGDLPNFKKTITI